MRKRALWATRLAPTLRKIAMRMPDEMSLPACALPRTRGPKLLHRGALTNLLQAKETPMKLSKKRQRELEDTMVGIFVNMIVEIYAQKEWIQEEGRAEFFKRVYEANLAKNSKELFLLGAEAECVFRQMPEAFNIVTERLKRKK